MTYKYRDKSCCSNGFLRHGSHSVDNAASTGKPALAGELTNELLSENPMRSAGTDTRSSSLRTASPAQAEMGLCRDRGLHEYIPERYCFVTDG